MKSLNKKGIADGVVEIAVGAILLVVLVIAVAYPIVVDSIGAVNTTGRSTDALILKYIPTILLVVGLVLMAGFLYAKKQQ
jgi:hypothetical protein